MNDVFSNNLQQIKKRAEIEKVFFADMDIGQFFYDTEIKVYGVKISRGSYFNLTDNSIRRLNEKGITFRQVYYLCDYEVFLT